MPTHHLIYSNPQLDSFLLKVDENISRTKVEVISKTRKTGVGMGTEMLTQLISFLTVPNHPKARILHAAM